MTILEKYQLEAQEDTHVDEMTISEKAMKIPGIKHKWVARLIKAKSDENRLKKLKAVAISKVSIQIKEKSSVSLSDNSIYNAALKHESVHKIDDSIVETREIIEYLERLEKIFASITWDYKNIIEVMKMETL